MFIVFVSKCQKIVIEILDHYIIEFKCIETYIKKKGFIKVLCDITKLQGRL